MVSKPTATSNRKGKTDWTHNGMVIRDIRMYAKFYTIAFKHEIRDEGYVVQVNRDIFDARLNSYFLGRSYSREDVLVLRWNLYLTTGYYVKINPDGILDRYEGLEGRDYISFLEVDGYFGEFSNIYNQRKE